MATNNNRFELGMHEVFAWVLFAILASSVFLLRGESAGRMPRFSASQLTWPGDFAPGSKLDAGLESVSVAPPVELPSVGDSLQSKIERSDSQITKRSAPKAKPNEVAVAEAAATKPPTSNLLHARTAAAETAATTKVSVQNVEDLRGSPEQAGEALGNYRAPAVTSDRQVAAPQTVGIPLKGFKDRMVESGRN